MLALEPLADPQSTAYAGIKITGLLIGAALLYYAVKAMFGKGKK
jgi:hypothetical protein